MSFLSDGVNLSFIYKYNNFDLLCLIVAAWPLTSITSQLRIFLFVYFIFLKSNYLHYTGICSFKDFPSLASVFPME